MEITMNIKNSMTEDIIDYFIEAGILKEPKKYSVGDRLTTDWFNNLEDKEREKVWKNECDVWWKVNGLKIFNELYTDEVGKMDWEGDVNDYYMNKVYAMLNNNKKCLVDKLKRRYVKGKNKRHMNQTLPKKNMRKTDNTILNNRGYKLGSGIELKKKITETLRETKMTSMAPQWVMSDPIYTGIEGSYIKIYYDPKSGTTTEGIEEIISVLRTEIIGWEYVMKHQEFYWKDSAWENKYDK